MTHSFPTRRSSDLSVQRFCGYDMRKIKDLKDGSESERSRRALESELVAQIKASDIRIVDDAVSAPVGQHFPGVNDIGAIDQSERLAEDRKSTRLHSSH